MNLLLLPLDDRPVTFTYPHLLAKSAGLEVTMPDRNLMGSLMKSAAIDDLLHFCENQIGKGHLDGAVVCIDSLLYGGLITSRRTTETIKEILPRLERIKKWKELAKKPFPIYVQSSIMRISDNYDNTEEKDYWSRYGREIFEWSTCLHRLAKGEKLAPGLLDSLERRIPKDIRQDYLDTRFRNFTLNQATFKALEEGFFDYLVFSQDDSGTFGLNVSEKERLVSMTKNSKLTEKVNIYAGADEVLLTMLSRFLCRELKSKTTPKIRTLYSPANCATLASRYEGQNIGDTVLAQLAASGAQTVEADSACDFTLIVHGPRERQGDHITLPGHTDLSMVETAKESTIKLLESLDTPVILIDVAYANGSDPQLVKELLARPELLKKVWSYAGWNTTGNTTGCALASAIVFQQSNGGTAKNRCLFTRFIDDWAYQSVVRKELDGSPSTQKLAELITPLIKQIAGTLNFEPPVRLSFPWKRTFEIEVGFEGN
jgi:hypothetical protein